MKLGELTVDLDAVLEEAMTHMDAEDDLRWAVGMALQELYWEEGIKRLQAAMFERFETDADSIAKYQEQQHAIDLENFDPITTPRNHKTGEEE